MNRDELAMRRIISFGVFILCLSIVGPAVANGQQHHKRSRSAKQTSPAPVPRANYGTYDFSMQTIDGAKIHLASYAGKIVLVNIWSPNCGPCKLETPGIVKLYSKYHAKGFEIVGVAVQTSESDVRSYIQTYGIPWVNGLNDSIVTAYGMYGLPDHYLFDGEGNLIIHFIGYTRMDVLEPSIAHALPAVIPQATKKK